MPRATHGVIPSSVFGRPEIDVLRMVEATSSKQANDMYAKNVTYASDVMYGKIVIYA